MLGLLLLLPAHALPPPASHGKLVSANGHGVVVLDPDHASGAVLTDFRDHLYQQYEAGAEPGRDLLYDAYFGLGDGETGAWLTSAAAATYEPGTGVLTIDRSQEGLSITELAFAPQAVEGPVYAQLLRLTNTGEAARTVRLYSLHNHHVGSLADSGAYTADEAIRVEQGEADELIEEGNATGLGMVVRALGGPDSYTCDRLWERMPVEGALDGRCGTAEAPWTFDDQVGGWQWTVELAPGEETWIGTVAAFYAGWDPSAARARLQAYVDGQTPASLVTAERDGWAAWLSEAAVPADATADELAVYRQALVFLKMGQVREEGAAWGQLPASLPVAAGSADFQHLWNITWVRDSAYAIAALAAAGYPGEAQDALTFLLQDKAGDYAHLVGRDYGLSVCRLYGDGSEWSDDDGTGPNVELDNFGLALWAAAEVLAAGGDPALLDSHGEVLFGGVADVLVDVIGEDGLVMADSSIWERHWYGNQERFAYTQAWAVRGLREAAALAEADGDAARAAGYAAAADTVRDGICAHLLDGDGVLAASREQLQRAEPYLDLAAVDALNNGTLDAASPEGQTSLAAWRAGLRTAAGGYKRNDDGDLYDEQEWIWADLRLAQALRRGCDEEGARALEDRVTAAAVANHWTIPELLDPDDASFAGPAPMMGFGSGLYVLALLGRGEAAADCADGVADACPTGGGDGGASDGGASDGGASDGGASDGGASDGGDGDGGDGDGGTAAGDTGADTGGPAPREGGCCRGGEGAALLLPLLPLLTLRRRR